MCVFSITLKCNVNILDLGQEDAACLEEGE